MTDIRKRFVLKPGKAIRLADIDTADPAPFADKEEAREQLAADAVAIDELQDRLYAERKRALLVVLQGMDTSGKDGTIRAVFGQTGPTGVGVTAFSRPSEEELAHDFLWRIHLACPRRGTIGIFNRSQYEDVLVGRVRNLAPPDVIEHRYDQINAFEDLISSSTKIIKIMLHISKSEQGERLQARLDAPDKRWKFNPGDLEDRARWDEYMAAYETVVTRCTTKAAPWYIVPSDRKWARNAIVAAIVRATLEEMNPVPPIVEWDPRQYKVN